MPTKALRLPMLWEGDAPPVVFRRGVGWCGVVVVNASMAAERAGERPSSVRAEPITVMW
jgi:hypothetical protein